MDMLGAEDANSAILYDADGVSNSEPCQLVVSNVASLKSRRTSNDYTAGLLVAETPVSIGQVVEHETAGWFIIAKAQNLSSVLLAPTPVKLQLLPLTDQLTFQRPAQAPPDPASVPLSGYGEPMQTGLAGYPVLPVVQITARVGYSNHMLSLTAADLGPVPTTSSITAYAPLDCGVQLGDETTIDGTPYVVRQASSEDANGARYALQLLLDNSAGAGFAPPS